MDVSRVTVVSARALLLSGVALLVVAGSVRAAAPAGARPAGPIREQDPGSFAPVSATEHTLGRIEIPRVSVSAPILEGVDDRTIRRAVGHFPETPLPSEGGNVALAAHRTTLFFGLRNIRIGDTITLTTPKGAFRYTVARTWVVDPTDVSVLDPSTENTLTLVTCYPFNYEGSAPQRFIVRALAAPILQPAPEQGEKAPAGPVRTSRSH